LVGSNLSAVAGRRTYRSGYSWYDEKRDPVDHRIDMVLPEDPGPVHAVQVSQTDRGFGAISSWTPWSYETALCGAVLKVESQHEFDAGDEDKSSQQPEPIARALSILEDP
jgi:hypothetical protein